MQQPNEDWLLRYSPASRLIWRGRKDGPNTTRFHEITRFVDLRETIPTPQAERSYGFLGFACDAGVQRNFGRPGASQGPDVLKQAMSNVPVPADIPLNLYDFGNVTCLDGNLEEAQAALGEVVALMLMNDFRPIILGGGHETAWAHFQGISKHLGTKNVGIINFDAHFDLRPLLDNNLGSSGTPFTQIAYERQHRGLPFHYLVIGLQRFGNTPALFEHAKELGVDHVLADEIHYQGQDFAQETLDHFIKQHEALYVSVDLDVFSTPYAPGVSAPQPLGLNPWHVVPMLRTLAKSKKVVSIDFSELSPIHDRDGATAQLAAFLIANYINP